MRIVVIRIMNGSLSGDQNEESVMHQCGRRMATRQKEQQVQSFQSRNMLGMFEEHQEGHCGWGRMMEGKSSSQCDTCCSCPVSSHIGKKRTFDFKYVGKQVEDS